MFLPENTTSRLQPLDAGIIKNFKVHYRRQLLKHVLTKVNEEGAGGSASSICKSVNILLAIKWIKEAWEEVGPDTIRNCFCHCGAIPDVEHQIERELSDPFADLDAVCDVHTLDDLLSQMDCGLTADQYVNEDEDVPTCLTFDGEDDAERRQNLRSAVVEGCLAKRQ